jgi:hypothetical protein
MFITSLVTRERAFMSSLVAGEPALRCAVVASA